MDANRFDEVVSIYKAHKNTMSDIYSFVGWLALMFSGYKMTYLLSPILEIVLSPKQANDWAEMLSGQLGGTVATIIVSVVCFWLFRKSTSKTYDLYEERLKEVDDLYGKQLKDKQEQIERLNNRIKELER